MKTIKLLIIITIIISSCKPNNQSDQIQSNDFINNLKLPPTPEVFLPKIIKTNNHEHNGILSPSMNEFYYTVSDTNYSQFFIFNIKLDDSFLTKGQKVSFSGNYSDHAISFTPDGNRMFFSSTRPDKYSENWNIWYLDKEDRDWGQPIKISFDGKDNNWESHVSASKNNIIYFHANYDGGGYNFDIYKSKFINETYSQPEKLSITINSEFMEISPFISPIEDYIIFTSYGRKDSFGDGDLYISFKNDKSQWTEAMNMGKTINSEFEESNPHVSPDGRILFFSSKRNGNLDVYFVDAQIIKQLKPNF